MATPNVTMFGDRVLIQVDEAEKQTDGGILIPAPAQKAPGTGEVVAHGPGIWQPAGFVETVVRIGDRVFFSARVATIIEVDGESYAMLTERDLFGILGSPETEEVQQVVDEAAPVPPEPVERVPAPPPAVTVNRPDANAEAATWEDPNHPGTVVKPKHVSPKSVSQPVITGKTIKKTKPIKRVR